MSEFDFVVIGSGVAGLSLSLKLAEHGSVAIVTKRQAADSNTAWAQGGVACVTSAEDSFDLHIKDTLIAGVGLCDQEAVRTIITEGPGAVRELMRIGVHFDERMLEGGQKELDLGKEGGHSKRRVLHYHDTTGREIEQRLLDAVVQERNIQILDNHMAVDLITTGKLGYTTEDRVIGVYVLNDASGMIETIRSDRVILATGGCGKVYLYTTNPGIATGDGVAMAWRAGAAVANMEFIQFHPTCLFHPEVKSFLISEAVRGEGGKLVDASGREFMSKYHKLAALAPRDIVSRCIVLPSLRPSSLKRGSYAITGNNASSSKNSSKAHDTNGNKAECWSQSKVTIARSKCQDFSRVSFFEQVILVTLFTCA